MARKLRNQVREQSNQVRLSSLSEYEPGAPG
jgi:hypothetical protein